MCVTTTQTTCDVEIQSQQRERVINRVPFVHPRVCKALCNVTGYSNLGGRRCGSLESCAAVSIKRVSTLSACSIGFVQPVGRRVLVGAIEPSPLILIKTMEPHCPRHMCYIKNVHVSSMQLGLCSMYDEKSSRSIAAAAEAARKKRAETTPLCHTTVSTTLLDHHGRLLRVGRLPVAVARIVAVARSVHVESRECCLVLLSWWCNVFILWLTNKQYLST